MFVAIVHHYCKPGEAEAAGARIDQNGDRMQAQVGFVFRYRMLDAENDHKVTTITAWEDEAAYERSRAQTPSRPKGEPTPYERTVREHYTVQSTYEPS